MQSSLLDLLVAFWIFFLNRVVVQSSSRFSLTLPLLSFILFIIYLKNKRLLRLCSS